MRNNLRSVVCSLNHASSDIKCCSMLQPYWPHPFLIGSIGELQASIAQDSILDKWNLKQLTLGERNKVVRPGDQIIQVQGEKDYKQMQKLLKQEPDPRPLLKRESQRFSRAHG